MEEQPLSQHNQESEVVIYAKITDMEGLSLAASHEDQYQVECRFETGATSRIRKTVKDGLDHIVFTIKNKNAAKQDDIMSVATETSLVVDESFMAGYRLIASREMNKIRYVFNSENVTLRYVDGESIKEIMIPKILYEVDVYKTESGSISEWCKIDIEVDSIYNYIATNHPDLTDIELKIKISHLPFTPVDAILMSSATDEEKAFVDNLWKTQFSNSLQ